MAKQATSIFIDDSIVTILRANGRNVQRWGSIPLDNGTVKDGVILDEETLVAKIKELFRTSHLGGGRIVAGISGINCLYRIISLPNMPRKMLPEAVNREAARVLGVPIEQFYLSWQLLPATRSEMRAVSYTHLRAHET